MISIIDYGVGNIFNIKKSLNNLGVKFKVTNSEIDIDNSNLILLPGVGSFGYASKMLKKNNLDKIIKKNVKKGKLLVGTCVGMQLLMNKSYEKGIHRGLGLIEGHVEHLENLFKINKEAKYPLIGYSKLDHVNKKSDFKKELNDKHFYFVHSFYANVVNKSNIIANNKYFNKEYPAVIRKDNVLGMQFHFEISGKTGQNLMNKIIKLSKKV